MEWTRELRYKPYADWGAKTLLDLQAQAAGSDYKLGYHIMPTSGLLNDPNGFSYYNGYWHVFYQSYPFGPVHGLKSWNHMRSKDLVHWENLGIGLNPDFEYDKNGAYSGSALQVGNKLFIMYNGNSRDENWVRHPYQLGAWMDENNRIEKLPEPLIKQPDHVTEHFRDPQIIKHKDEYYAIIGAQDATQKDGRISIYRSKDLKNFEDLGYLHFTDENMGYMIECPSLSNLMQDVLKQATKRSKTSTKVLTSTLRKPSTHLTAKHISSAGQGFLKLNTRRIKKTGLIA